MGAEEGPRRDDEVQEVEEAQGKCRRRYGRDKCWRSGWWWCGKRSPQPDPLPNQPAPGDQRDDAEHALQPVPRVQGGPTGARSSRHRLRRVRDGNAIGRGKGRAPGVQNYAHHRYQDIFCKKIWFNSLLVCFCMVSLIVECHNVSFWFQYVE